MAAQEEHRMRLPGLNQAPIDIWSTREKLALATSVQKSGDQNWNSVSRPLKSFAEENRPQDWFNAKFCAIQYRDMLEKIEVPKRKRERKERAEETAQDLIVKKLTNERIDELGIIIRDQIAKFCEQKNRLDKLKAGNNDDKFVENICSYIRENKKIKQQEQLEHEKWLAEREAKILAMNRRGPIPRPFKPIIPVVADSLVDEETKVRLSDDKATRNDHSATVFTGEPSSEPEKDTSLLSSILSTVPPVTRKSPRPSVELSDEKVIEAKYESSLRENKTNEVEKEDIESASDDTLKTDSMDVVESKNTSADEVICISDDKLHRQAEVEQRNDVKNEVNMEQENSNDTIEEIFESAAATPNKDELEPIVNVKNESSKSTPKDIPDSVHSTSHINSSITEKVSQESSNKELAEIKIEDDNSPSMVETKNSTMDTSATHDDTSMDKLKRKRRKSQKVTNAPVMQTRSTRSQSHIKIEEHKEVVVKVEGTKSCSKKRSNSADETSVDNTMSEESNDGKSSANDSTPSEVEVDHKWKKSALIILRSLQAHPNASLFSQPISDGSACIPRAIFRHMDLNIIKRRIDNGQVRNNIELKRDIMLMFSNANMANQTDDRICKAAEEMEKEVFKLFDPSEKKVTRTREKTMQTPETKTNRRKTRGSISLDNKSSANKKKN